jgi:hypothetical protein
MKSTDGFGTPGTLVASVALILACGCSGTVDGPESSGGTGLTGSGATGAAPGTGGSSTGGAGPQGGAQSGGTGGSATGGAGGTVSPGTGGTGGSTGGAGGVGGAGGAGGTLIYVDPPPFEPATGMLRRLTVPQFHNAIRDLLGVEVDISLLHPDSYAHANSATISAAFANTPEPSVLLYHAAIETAVGSVFSDAGKRATLLGCTPTGTAGDACIRGFVESLGRRAWRRPLEAAEVDRLAAVATNATTALGSAVEGARWATVALLESPSFLYRPELGVVANGVQRLTAHETASRLAFLSWNSVPDDTLLDVAEAGGLSTPEGIRSAAQRLLDSPAGREAVTGFVDEYMAVFRIATQPKNVELFAEY